jgi:hypothetical protein
VRKSKPEQKLSTATEGQLLEKLVSYIGGKKADFCSTIKITPNWLLKQTRSKHITPKIKESILEKYGIPFEYWTGDYELPEKKTNTMMVNEPDTVTTLKQQLREKDALIIKLQSELIRVLSEAKKA